MRLRTASAALALLLAGARCVAAALQPAAPVAVPIDATARLQRVLEECRGTLSDDPVGLPELEQRCPALQAALQAAGIRALLIDSSRPRLYRDSLRQLGRLVHRPAGPAPTTASLEPILRALRGPAAPPRSWWQRLWDWLAAHLSVRQGQQAAQPWLNGLVRLLGRATWLWAVIIWSTVIALPIAVVVIVLREVRALGARSLDQRPAAPAGRSLDRSVSELALLRRAPLAERPARLFALLVARLVAAGRLPPDRSLTHREIVRRALLDDAQQRGLIESLARLSEWQLYAAQPTPPAGLAELLARAEDLYTVGWSPPARPPGAGSGGAAP